MLIGQHMEEVSLLVELINEELRIEYGDDDFILFILEMKRLWREMMERIETFYFSLFFI